MFNKTVEIVNKFPDKMDVNLHEEDRVNITLKEYNSLKKENEELRQDLNFKKDYIKKLVEPFVKADIPEEIFRQIIDGKFESEVKIAVECDDPLYAKVIQIVRVRKTDKF